MATKARDATPKNEKKAIPIPSSNPQPFNRQGSSKSTASRLGSNEKDKQTSAATSPGRHTPNYLKPALSSKAETSLKNVKKSPSGHHVLEDTTSSQNPTLLRRRSFDKPSSASHKQRSAVSPDPKERAATRVRTTPLKSASLSSNKPVSITPKPGASKPFKPAQKSQPPGASTKALRRNSSASRENGINSAPVSSSNSPTKTDKTAQGFNPEKKQYETNEGTLAHDEAEEVQLSPDVPEPDNEQLEAVDSQVCNAEDEKLGLCDVPEASEGQVVHQDSPVEETQSELVHNKETEVENQPEGEEDQGIERSSGHQEEGSPNEVREIEADQKEGVENEIDGPNIVSGEQAAFEEKKQEEMDKIDGKEIGKKVQSSREGGEANEEAKEMAAPPHGAALSAQKRPVGQGKKEYPTAYNDVIEETKNKLLEARKNKVKALVGAFETVIDYESGSK